MSDDRKMVVAGLMIIIALIISIVIIKMQNTPEELKQQIDALSARIASIESIQTSTQGYNSQDPNFKNAVRRTTGDFLPNDMFDAFWDKIFYYSSMYESLDGVSLQGNVPTINDTGITMATAAVLNSTSIIVKDGIAQKVTSFGKRQRFRITLEFSNNSLTNSNGYFTTGLFGIGEQYYGFEFNGTTLKGSSSNINTVASNAVTLATLATLKTYELEAVLFPGEKVIFYINGEEKGIVTTDIPIGWTVAAGYLPNNFFYNWMIKTTDAGAKSVSVGLFEYIQERYSAKK